MADLFISYSRKDREFADKLVGSLKDHGKECWIDRRDIPATADYRDEIVTAIAEASNFAFLLSPDSITSQYCANELAHAVDTGKRLIPILCRPVDGQTMPGALESLQWISFCEESNFQTALVQLIEVCDKDLVWARYHAWLTMRENEWETNHHSDSRLLRGSDITDAEGQVTRNTGKEPHPSQQQREYILISRQAQLRRQRLTFTGVAIALVITIILALMAWQQRGEAVIQSDQRATAEINAVNESHIRATAQAVAEDRRQEADDQRNIALARQLAAEANLMRDQDPNLLPRSMLLAIESMKRSRSFAGDQALRNGLAILPRLEARLDVRPDGSTHTELDINCIAFSPNGRWLATGSQAAIITVWDTTNWHEAMRISLASTYGVVPVVRSLVFHPNSSWLAVGTDTGTTTIWDVASSHEIAHFNQNGQIFGLAFSPDGSWVASGGEGNVALWESITGRQLYTVSTSSELVVFSPDGTLIAAGGSGDKIKVWEAKSGRLLTEKRQFTRNGYGDLRAVTTIAFSPDSKLIASSDGGSQFAFTVPRQPVGGTILVWEATTGREITHMQHDDEVLGLAFSPDGKQLASASYDRTARVWDSHTGEKISSFVHNGPVNALVFSEDGKSIVSVSSDGVGRVWEISSGKEIARLPTESKVKIEVVAMNSTTHHIAMGDANGRVWVWGINTDYVTSMPHGNSIASVNYSPDAKLLATASWDKTARVWDATTGQQIAEIPHESMVVAAVFSPDGLWMASGSLTGTIKVWSTKAREVRYTFQVESVGSLVFSPDGKWLAVAQGDPPNNGWFIQGKRMSAVSEKSDAIVLWNMGDGREALRLINPAPARSVAFNPDSTLLASASDNGTAQVWDLTSGSVISRNYHKYPVNWVSFSPDGKWVASAESCVPQFGSSYCDPMVIKIWDPKTGREAWRTVLNGSWVSALTFSPNGKLLAAGNSYLSGCPSGEPECVDTAHVWDVSSGREVSRLTQDKYVTALVFSPDGSQIATGGDDKTLRIWDTRTGQELERMTGAQDNEVWSIAFSPDGRRIAAGGYDSPHLSLVKIYPLDSADLIQMACSRLWRNLTAAEWRNYLDAEPYQSTCPNIDQTSRITSYEKDVSLIEGTFGRGYDLSADGRYVVFASGTSNLVPTDTNRSQDVFLLDRTTHQFTRVSVTSDGSQGYQDSTGPTISADGRFIAFSTNAYNLVGATGPENGFDSIGVLLHDTQTGQTSIVSITLINTQTLKSMSAPHISADGLFVAYVASYNNGDSSKVFLYDRQQNVSRLVSQMPSSEVGDANAPSISADGRYVAFTANVTSTVISETHQTSNVFVYDRSADRIKQVSLLPGGIQPNGNSCCASISEDGQSIVFTSDSTELLTTTTHGEVQNSLPNMGPLTSLFLYSMANGQITYLPVKPYGLQTFTGMLASASISADGRYVAFTFQDYSHDEGISDVFVYDRASDKTIYVSKPPNGSRGNDYSDNPIIHGHDVIFSSGASNLVDGDTNGRYDLFVYDLETGQNTRLAIPGPESNSQ